MIGLATPLLAILSVVMLLGALALVAISLAYIRQPRSVVQLWLIWCLIHIDVGCM